MVAPLSMDWRRQRVRSAELDRRFRALDDEKSTALAWRALAHEALHELEEAEARYAVATRINAQTTYFPIHGSESEGRVVFELPEGLAPGDSITIKNVGKDRVTIVPRPQPPAEFLTADEFRALDLLVQFINQSSAFISGNDWREFVDKVHQLQSQIMSNAAARAYPTEFRLLGESKRNE